MQILKHQKNGRLFVATPALLKNAKMVPAPDDEAKAFVAAMSKESRKRIEESKSTQSASLMMPKDLDPLVNIQNWGKPQLMALASQINLTLPATLKVKELRPMLQSALDELAEKAKKEESKEGTSEADKGDA